MKLCIAVNAMSFPIKVKSNVSLARVDPDSVYNGKCQLIVLNSVNILFCSLIRSGKNLAKGHEPMLCEAPKFCWSFL